MKITLKKVSILKDGWKRWFSQKSVELVLWFRATLRLLPCGSVLAVIVILKDLNRFDVFVRISLGLMCLIYLVDIFIAFKCISKVCF